MTHMIRACSVLIAAAMGLGAAAAPVLAQNAPQCPVSGSPSDWGVNSIGYIQINSGGKLLVFSQRQGRNIEFERFTEAGTREVATHRQVFIRLHVESRI
jgi:hypothetical protein